jgi:hypothetical protein
VILAHMAPAPSLWQSAVVAALVAGGISLLTIWVSGRRARQDRQRQLFADAFGACIDYREFAFIVRRRRQDDPEDRIRITGELSEVQRRLSHLKAVLRVENRRVGNEYQSLVRATKDIAGPQISAGWDLPAAESDSDVGVGDVDLRPLDEHDDRFLQTVEDHLGLGPRWLRLYGCRARRQAARLVRRD